MPPTARDLEGRADLVENQDLRTDPAYVRKFFHPETLRSTLALLGLSRIVPKLSRLGEKGQPLDRLTAIIKRRPDTYVIPKLCLCRSVQRTRYFAVSPPYKRR